MTIKSREQSTMYIDAHIIQTMPPSCVNRDDTGSPKTSMYGGVLRARVSSQAWKKIIKNAMKGSYLTKLGSTLVADKIKLLANESLANNNFNSEEELETAKWLAGEENEEDRKTVAFDLISAVTNTKESADTPKATNVLLFLSDDEIRCLAEESIKRAGLTRKIENKKISKKTYDAETKELTKSARDAFLKSRKTAAHLFGRMLADDRDLNVDACVQVAHALSTHKISNEYDYYTAVDDVKESQGAAFVSVSEYNSSTLYRYATVAVHDLFQNTNCKKSTEDLTVSFIDNFVNTIPTGKQNSFANHTPPDKVFFSIRTDKPVSLVAAFERPIKVAPGEESGYTQKSIDALFGYHSQKKAEGIIGLPAREMATGKVPEGVESKTYPEMLSEIKNTVSTFISSQEVNNPPLMP